MHQDQANIHGNTKEACWGTSDGKDIGDTVLKLTSNRNFMVNINASA